LDIKREKVTGWWGKNCVMTSFVICNPHLTLPRWSDQDMRWREEKRVTYWIFTGKSEGMRPLGRPDRRCEDNIETCLREI
jgi:hypothetical protein